MKTKYITALTIGIISIASCSNKLKESEALAYLDEARQYYYTNNLDQAYTLLDSLPTKYPWAMITKKMSMALRDSITRSESSYKIDRIYDQINEYKIAITGLTWGENNESEITLLNTKIDSLQKQTQPLRKIVNEITGKELQLAARTQCVTCMKANR